MNTLVLKGLLFAAERILSLIKPDEIRKGLDELLERLEKRVTESENTVDDRLILPLVRILRAAFGEVK